METVFQQKVKEYQAIKDADEQKAEQLLNELRRYIINLVGGLDPYPIDNQEISISIATIEELCIIYEDMKRTESANALTSISDSERDRQTSNNLYGSENTYLEKYNFNNA